MKGKGVPTPTKFDRELKRLEWNMKDKGRRKGATPGRGARVSQSGFFMKLIIHSWNVRGANDATKRTFDQGL